MDYIILNNDGSLKESSLKRYIQQGNHGVDKIFIGWSLGLSTDYGQAVFTLANQLTNTVLGEFKENYPYEADDPENPPSDYAGETCNGWVITLTSDQTTYNGGLFVSFRVIRNGIVQVAFPFTLMINETGVRPDTDSGVTIAQLDSYLLNIQNLVANNVLMNVDGALSNTSENPVQNKVITAAIEAIKRGSYTKVDTTEYPTLEDFLDSEGEEGFLYLYPVNTSDEDDGYYQYIWENDLWIPLGSTEIDIANMMTTDTNQTVTGSKTFNDKINFSISGVTTLYHLFENASEQLEIGRTYNNTYAALWLIDGRDFVPKGDNENKIGSSSKRISTVYTYGIHSGGGNFTLQVGSNIEIYCNQNAYMFPNQDGYLYLGKSNKRFGCVFTSSIANDYSALQIRGKGGVSFQCDSGSSIRPSTNGQLNLGSSDAKWNYIYVNYVSDGTATISVSDIAKKSEIATINGQSITNGGNVQITVSQSGLFKHEVTLSDGTNSYKLMIINNNSSQFSTSTGMAWNGVFNSCLKMLYYDPVSTNWYLVTHLQYVNSNFSVQFAKESSFDSVSMSSINSINDSVSPY